MIEFTSSKVEHDLIEKIVERFIDYCKSHHAPCPGKVQLLMDMSCANAKCPLKLHDLLVAEDRDFTHDIYGIWRHLDRKTGTLEDCFLPRYAYQG